MKPSFTIPVDYESAWIEQSLQQIEVAIDTSRAQQAGAL
jgi:hypothetical protein